MKFSALELHPDLLAAVSELGFATATAIQEKSIPLLLAGNDLIASAQTGTGKTAAFMLPILQQLLTGQRADKPVVKVLVLTPTRELAQQVAEHTQQLIGQTPLTVACLYGGANIGPQEKTPKRWGGYSGGDAWALIGPHHQKHIIT